VVVVAWLARQCQTNASFGHNLQSVFLLDKVCDFGFALPSPAPIQVISSHFKSTSRVPMVSWLRLALSILPILAGHQCM